MKSRPGDRRDFGVYVHFPFCRHLCPYCDFAVAVARAEAGIPHDEYGARVAAELADRAADYAGRRLVSIYLGGGTPSLWRIDCLAALITDVTSRFDARPGDLEITLEANPTDCTAETMAAWRAIGINRLSIGVQSLQPAELVALGRDHRMGDGAAAVEAALGAGFARVSADAIIGIPGSLLPAGSPASPPGVAGLLELVELAGTGEASGGSGHCILGHLSVYELTIEERTAFGRAARAGTLHPFDDEILAELYSAVHHALAARGFEHYEISSYARPGQRSVHNQLYWRGAEYLGLGNGAASFRLLDDSGAGERVTNHRSVKRYLALASSSDRIAERALLAAEELALDRLWLGMRTADGVPEKAFASQPEVREWLLIERLAELRDGRICPTLKGFLYCDRIASRLVAG